MTTFVVPKEPPLLWTMLAPQIPRQLPHPFDEKPTYYTFWARNAIYYGLRALGVLPGETILIPSFLCAAAVEPIFRYGAQVKFYHIRRDCSPDFEDIQAKIDKSTRAVMAVHYFGFPQPIREFQQLCQDHNIYLIEDCAHVLTGEIDGTMLGTFGDISIFSWRKFLPIYDGGQLVINNKKMHVNIPWKKHVLIFNLKVIKNIGDKLIEDSNIKIIDFISYLLQSSYTIIRRLVTASRLQAKVLTVNNYSLDFDLSSVNLPMSAPSRYILQSLDISAIVKKRRCNAISLLNAIEQLSGLTPVFSPLAPGVCPLALPVFAPGRQDFHKTLRAKGIPAFTWGDVIHPQLPLEEFPEAAFLYRNLVLLPVHQGLGDTDMRLIFEIAAEALQGTSD